jgi:hypothetical protein
MAKDKKKEKKSKKSHKKEKKSDKKERKHVDTGKKEAKTDAIKSGGQTISVDDYFMKSEEFRVYLKTIRNR